MSNSYDPLQAPLSMGFSRQEYWSGLPFSLPVDLPYPGIELASAALTGRFFGAEPPGKPLKRIKVPLNTHCMNINKPVWFCNFAVVSSILSCFALSDGVWKLRSKFYPLGLKLVRKSSSQTEQSTACSVLWQARETPQLTQNAGRKVFREGFPSKLNCEIWVEFSQRGGWCA